MHYFEPVCTVLPSCPARRYTISLQYGRTLRSDTVLTHAIHIGRTFTDLERIFEPLTPTLQGTRGPGTWKRTGYQPVGVSEGRKAGTRLLLTASTTKRHLKQLSCWGTLFPQQKTVSQARGELQAVARTQKNSECAPRKATVVLRGQNARFFFSMHRPRLVAQYPLPKNIGIPGGVDGVE